MNASPSHRDEQPAELISGVLADAREYAVAEVDKIKAETISKAKEIGEDVKLGAISLLTLTVAALMLATAIACALIAAGLPAWASFGIMAVVFAVAGVLCLKRIGKKSSDNKPTPAIDHH